MFPSPVSSSLPSFSSMLSAFIPRLLEHTNETKRLLLEGPPLGAAQQTQLMDNFFGAVVFDLAGIMHIGRDGCTDDGGGRVERNIPEKMMIKADDAAPVEEDSDVEFLPENGDNRDSGGIAKDGLPMDGIPKALSPKALSPKDLLGSEDEEEEDGDEVFDRHDPEYRVQLPSRSIINKPVVVRRQKKVVPTGTRGARSIMAISLSCRDCGLEFADKDLLDVHAASVHSVQPFRCEQNGCRKSFASKFELSHHHRTDHSFETRWACGSCDRWYTSHPNLRHHVSMYHQLGVFRCGQCGAFEGNHRTRVYLHQMRDHSNKKGKNKVIKKTRKRKKMMGRTAAATSSHKINCGLCGLSFASTKMVILHKRAVHGKR